MRLQGEKPRFLSCFINPPGRPPISSNLFREEKIPTFTLSLRRINLRSDRRRPGTVRINSSLPPACTVFAPKTTIRWNHSRSCTK
nr:MAG TPA: hypothetical protein [Caudoviricetes sp.]